MPDNTAREDARPGDHEALNTASVPTQFRPLTELPALRHLWEGGKPVLSTGGGLRGGLCRWPPGPQFCAQDNRQQATGPSHCQCATARNVVRRSVMMTCQWRPQTSVRKENKTTLFSHQHEGIVTCSSFPHRHVKGGAKRRATRAVAQVFFLVPRPPLRRPSLDHLLDVLTPKTK